MREQRAVKLHAQLAGVVVADGVAHGDHGRHAALQQRVGGAGVTGLLFQRDVFAVLAVFRGLARLFALGHGDKIVPVVHAQDVAGMTRAQEKQARDKAARIDKKLKQFLAGQVIFGAAGFGEFEQVQVPVPAPMDDVVTAVLLNLVLQPCAGDAVAEEMGFDAAFGVNLRGKQGLQFLPFQTRRQRARAACFGKHKQHAQAFAGFQCQRLRRRGLHVVDDAHQQIAFGQRRFTGGRARNLPGDAGERGGEEIVVFGRAGQLDAQGARGFCGIQ